MRTEGLRLVEYNTNNKKDHKITTGHVDNRKGYFHLWRVERKAYAAEYFIGLIEDIETGELFQIKAENIKFLPQEYSGNGIDDFENIESLKIHDDDGLNDWAR